LPSLLPRLGLEELVLAPLPIRPRHFGVPLPHLRVRAHPVTCGFTRAIARRELWDWIAGSQLIMDAACLDAACPICQTEVDWAVYPGNRWTSTCSKCGCVHTIHGGEVTLDTTACAGRRASKQTSSVAPITRFKCMACRSTYEVQPVDGYAAIPWVWQVYGSAWLHPFDQLREPALCRYCRLMWAAQVTSGASTSTIGPAEPQERPSGACATALWLDAPVEERVSHGASASDDTQAEPQRPGLSWVPKFQRLWKGNQTDRRHWQ